MKNGIDLFGRGDQVDLSVFGAEFTSFKRSAKRLETLPRYSIPSEQVDVEHFEAGLPPRPEMNADWVEILDAASARGAAVSRIRLIGEPPTPYEQFELKFAYRLNVDHGESIRSFRRSDLEARYPLGEVIIDFWAFDSDRAYLMHYDARGGFLGVTRTSQQDGLQLVAEFDALWPLSHPL